MLTKCSDILGGFSNLIKANEMYDKINDEAIVINAEWVYSLFNVTALPFYTPVFKKMDVLWEHAGRRSGGRRPLKFPLSNLNNSHQILTKLGHNAYSNND